MTANDDSTAPHESKREHAVRQRLAHLLAAGPVPPEQLVDNLGLYLRRQPLTDLLSLDALYRMVLNVPGVMMEFGVHWGRHIGVLMTRRGMYEPHHPHRRIVGFDTFTGLPDMAEIDAVGGRATVGKFAVPAGYPAHLRAVLDAHEDSEHLQHIRRTLVVQGDVRETLPLYLADNPQTVIALAYFDLDLYEPTRAALDAIRPHLVRGSVLAFDQLGHANWPGETTAIRDSLDHCRLRLLPGRATPAYLRWGSEVSGQRHLCQQRLPVDQDELLQRHRL
jgi:hypothetical protein